MYFSTKNYLKNNRNHTDKLFINQLVSLALYRWTFSGEP
jgi:hypothetical protein